MTFYLGTYLFPIFSKYTKNNDSITHWTPKVLNVIRNQQTINHWTDDGHLCPVIVFLWYNPLNYCETNHCESFETKWFWVSQNVWSVMCGIKTWFCGNICWCPLEYVIGGCCETSAGVKLQVNGNFFEKWELRDVNCMFNCFFNKIVTYLPRRVKQKITFAVEEFVL